MKKKTIYYTKIPLYTAVRHMEKPYANSIFFVIGKDLQGKNQRIYNFTISPQYDFKMRPNYMLILASTVEIIDNFDVHIIFRNLFEDEMDFRYRDVLSHIGEDLT